MQNDQPHVSSNLFVSKLSRITYPCFITWRFHNFITSFSPSLTSENSSICWRLGGRIGKETNTPIRTACLLPSSESIPKIQLIHKNIYIKFRLCSQKSKKKSLFMWRFVMINYIIIYSPNCVLLIPASPLWRRKAATNNENLFEHKETEPTLQTEGILEKPNFDSINFHQQFFSKIFCS